MSSLTPAQERRARWLRPLRTIARRLGVVALLIYGLWTYGGGTQMCARCGVQREARQIGPFWFHSWISDHDRERWGWKGISVCSKHSWAKAGCWYIDGAICCYFGPTPPRL